MAGMVVAIASMLAINVVARRLTAEGNKLNELLDIEPDFMKPEGSTDAQNAE